MRPRSKTEVSVRLGLSAAVVALVAIMDGRVGDGEAATQPKPQVPRGKLSGEVLKKLPGRVPGTNSGASTGSGKGSTSGSSSGATRPPPRDDGAPPPSRPPKPPRPPRPEQSETPRPKPPRPVPPIVIPPIKVPPVVILDPPRPARQPKQPPVVIVDPVPPKSTTQPPRPPRLPPVVVVPPPQQSTPPGRPATRIPLPLQPPATASAPPPRRIIPLPPLAPPPVPPVIVPAFLPDEVLITVQTAALPQLEADVAQAFNVTILERTPLPLIDARLVRMRIPDGRAVPQVVALLAADPRVVAAQPNYLYRHNNDPRPRAEPAAAVSASAATVMSGLQYSLAKLGATDVHRVALGRGARIAVLDSGVDASHPDFAEASIAHFDATDDPRPNSAEFDTHGTGIVGIIAAKGTMQGVAPGAAIASARVFRKGAYGSTATTASVIKGMTWSVETGARILNMSFAGPRDALVERHVKAVAQRGIVAIAAAGNFGAAAAPAFPAAYEGVIAVTAIDANDRLYEKANRGAYVTLAAPGVDVIVPAVGRTHHFQSGTSFAAAHVSGVAALLLEVDATLTPEALRGHLIAAAEDLGTAGRDNEFGAGRLNAARAADLARAARP